MGRGRFVVSCSIIARLLLVCGAALLLGRIAISASGDGGENQKALCAFNLLQAVGGR